MKNLKALTEKRNALIEEMEALTNKALEETRAMTEEEVRDFDAKKAEVEAIDRTIAAAETEMQKREMKVEERTEEQTDEEAEERAFEAYVRGIATGETRALSAGENGDIIPTRIANRIIEEVKVLSPILTLADVYYTGGNLVFPVYKETTDKSISAAYVAEFTELTENTGTFDTVELKGFIAGVLAKVSKSLIRNTDFDINGFVIRKVAEAISIFLNKELIVGTSGKMEGIVSTTNTVEGGAELTADGLIDLQVKIPEVYQRNAVFIMHPKTWAQVRKLKDSNKQYLVGGLSTLEEGKGYQLLGKRVLLDENMPVTGKVVIYGDMKGLAVKFANRLEMTILREKYATQYAVGACAYVEADSKIVNHQMITALNIA